MAPSEWLEESIRYFRGMGFFDALSALSDAELSDRLDPITITYDVQNPISSYLQWADLSLIGQDEQRVWFHDTEADVGPGNRVYERTLAEWATISRGAFQPEDIREVWKGEDGPIRLFFEHYGKPVQLEPHYNDDWIDLWILGDINRLMLETGLQFEACVPDQSAYIIALKAEEKARLKNERGWEFTDHP